MMNKYWLIGNMMYNVKHIRRVTWWRKLFGKPSLFIDEVDAISEQIAEKKFRLKGHHFGLFH